MKCAICFSGDIRTFNKCYPTFVKHIISPLKKNNIEYDIFCHFWKNSDNNNVIQTLKPKKYLEENQFHFVLPNFCKGMRFYTGKFNKIEKYISYNILQYYGINRSFSLPDNSYNLAIRLRYDDYFNEDISINELNSGNIWVGNGHLFLLNGIPTNINDSYAFGTFEQMHKYSLYYNYIPQLLKIIKDKKLPEKYKYFYNAIVLTQLFRYYLFEHAKLEPKYTKQKYGLYRNNGNITYYNDNIYCYKGNIY